MIDAYDIQQSIRSMWGSLSRIVSGDSVKKTFPEVPVYVKIDDKLLVVTNVKEVDGKIILETNNE